MKKRVLAVFAFSLIASASAYADGLGCFINCKKLELATDDCLYICNG